MTDGWRTACANCGTRATRHWRLGLCDACYIYQWRYGRPRPVQLAPRSATCRQCGRQAKQYHWRGHSTTLRRGLCARCYVAAWKIKRIVAALGVSS